MESIRDYRRNCVLVALKEVSGKTDAEVLEAVRKNGYRKHRGMTQEDYMNAAKDLGIKIGTVVHSYQLIQVGGNAKSVTVADVIKRFRKGVYFVRAIGHLLVLREGRLVDLNYNRRPSLKRGIITVTEVLNPHVPLIKGFVKVMRYNPCKRGTGHWRRYELMRNYVNYHKGEVTRSQLLIHCEYTSSDFEWDLKRGNIAIV